jgi:hypothetical protein
MSVKVKIDRRIEIAPGVTKYELSVSEGKPGVAKPKIDEDFAKRFKDRLIREARTVMPTSEYQAGK